MPTDTRINKKIDLQKSVKNSICYCGKKFIWFRVDVLWICQGQWE